MIKKSSPMRASCHSFLALLLLLLLCGGATAAVLDIDDVTAQINRPGRAPIEGIWEINQSWDPSADQAKSYWMGIVKNTFGIKGAQFIGVVMCDKKGTVMGQVRMKLNPTKKKGEYIALFSTSKGDAKGILVQVNDKELDMSRVVLKQYPNDPLIKGINRVN